MTREIFIQTLINRVDDLGEEDYFFFLDEIYKNKVHPVEIVAFLSSLSSRELSQCAMVSFLKYIYSKWPKKNVGGSKEAINIVGTGGGIPTFNISTATTFVASAAGVTIIKSGSPSFTSKSGSLDVLKALGVKLNLTFEKFEQMIESEGLGFVNPNFLAPILRKMALLIQPLTIKNIGNFINMAGPFLCPVHVKSQLIGVNSRSLLNLAQKVSRQINVNDNCLCHSEIGMDEISSIGKTHFAGGDGAMYTLDAKKLGFVQNNPQNLRGGTPSDNANIIVGILKGKIRDEKYDTVLLNSAFLLKMSGIVDEIKHGLEISQKVIRDGIAFRKLEKTIEVSNKN